MIGTKVSESELLRPVLTLFSESHYWHFEQVPLGRKKIDLVCVERNAPNTGTSIELKISDWRRALWQATINFQLADQSYIAIWHEYVHRVTREIDLLKTYGVGLIAVYSDAAEFLLGSIDRVQRFSRYAKRSWYQQLLEKCR